MSFTKAKTTDIVKDYLNARLLEIAKIRHTKNHNTNDENYTDVVIRQGWTYKQGANADELEIDVNIGMTYDDYPIISATCIGIRATTSGAPTGPEDFDILALPGVIIDSIVTSHSTIKLHLTRGTGANLLSTEYYGVSWITIGKKV